jgi:hypothetical protein
MTLRDWLLNGWLKPHTTSPREISDLFSLIDRDLADCQAADLSADGRLNIAYNAALQQPLPLRCPGIAPAMNPITIGSSNLSPRRSVRLQI